MSFPNSPPRPRRGTRERNNRGGGTPEEGSVPAQTEMWRQCPIKAATIDDGSGAYETPSRRSPCLTPPPISSSSSPPTARPPPQKRRWKTEPVVWGPQDVVGATESAPPRPRERIPSPTLCFILRRTAEEATSHRSKSGGSVIAP